MGGSGSSEPEPNPEFDSPWRRFDWGQKAVLKKRLERFSVSHPDVKFIRILVAGQIGAGKSSFINSVNNVFQGRITSGAIVDTSGAKSESFTKQLKAHRVRSENGDLPFYLSDVMGLEPERLSGSRPEDIIKIIHGHIKDQYKFNPEQPLSQESEDYISDPLLSDKAFCLVYIVDASTVQYIDDRLNEKLREIRHAVRDNRIPQVIIMTKVDEACEVVNKNLRKVYTSKKIKEKMQMCSDNIGVPMNSIFPVKNYCDEIDIDDDVDVLILKAFDQIVNFANDRLRETASD